MDLAGRQFDRILLIKPSSLGDVIHALPVLRGLRRRFPEARIDWLIATVFAPLLDGHPDLTDLVLFDRRRFGRMAFSPRAASEFLSFMAELRARRYDLVIDLQGLFRSGFLTRATAAPVRLGFQNAREGARMFYTHRIETPRADMHAVDKNYLVSQVLGFTDIPIEFHLPISPSAEAEADRLTSPPPRGGFRGGEDAQGGAMLQLSTIVIAPGARWETKRWFPERFAETVDRLHSELRAPSCRPGATGSLPASGSVSGLRSGVQCVLVGGKEDRELCAAIARRCANPPLDLSGRTTLQGLVAVIARAGLVICHDSGVAHIAAALDRPLVCITGPTNPRRTGPYRRERDVLRLDLECSPCYFRRLAQCPHQHRCMRELDVAQVTAAAQGSIRESEPLKRCWRTAD